MRYTRAPPCVFVGFVQVATIVNRPGVRFVSSPAISEVFARAGVEPEVVAKWVGMPLSSVEDVFVYEVQTR